MTWTPGLERNDLHFKARKLVRFFRCGAEDDGFGSKRFKRS